jgi:hypothetical protein
MEDHCEPNCLHVRTSLFGGGDAFRMADVVETISFFAQLHAHNVEIIAYTLDAVTAGTHCRTDDYEVALELRRPVDTIGVGPF